MKMAPARSQTASGTVGDGGGSAVGYYGQPIVKPHVWIDAIGVYFFTGGMSGAASILGAVAELSGRPDLARHARRASIAGLLPSPPLLIADLGRPARFHHMLRVFRPTSPMSVGSWVLVAFSGASGLSWIAGEVGVASRSRRLLAPANLALGGAMAVYTAVLVADTATPAWRAARRELPALFASSAGASAGAATQLAALASGSTTPVAANLAAVGVIGEVVAAEAMRHRLGDLDVTKRDASTRRWQRAATALSVAGGIGSLVGRRSRAASVASAVAVLAGSLCQRLAALRAGTASATDPRYALIEQETP